MATASMSEYQRVSPRRLHEDVVSQIARQIIGGDLRAGAALPSEAELSSQLGVSRTVVREAARVLVAKGLVAVRQGSGMWVQSEESWDLLDPLVLATHLQTRPDSRLIDDLFEARRLVEVEVAGLAAERRTDADLARLEEHLTGMRSDAGDLAAYAFHDLEFHRGLYVAARNVVLRRLVWLSVELLNLARTLSLPEAIRHEESHRGHEIIFTAVRDRNAALARQEVLNHLDVAKDTLKRSLFAGQSGSALVGPPG